MQNIPVNSSIEIFSTESGGMEVRVSGDTMFLSLNQIAELFERDKSVISRHLKNIFKEEELDRDSVVAFFATTALDGKNYNVEYFNLDAILSVGYRVNSKKGTSFRKWASNVLKNYLTEGYSLNREKLHLNKIVELQNAIDLIAKTLTSSSLILSPGADAIEIIRSYAKTWDLLVQYDEARLDEPKGLKEEALKAITYEYAVESIAKLKQELGATKLFGLERDENGLRSILGNLMQTFAGRDLYPSREEKAAHLLYFVIKDHPFSDGNKRIGSFLFLLYMKITGMNLKIMNENTITALSLLIASSIPAQKDLMIRLIMHILA